MSDISYYCLHENEDGVPCGRKIEGKVQVWFAEGQDCICRECMEEMQRIDEEEMNACYRAKQNRVA